MEKINLMGMHVASEMRTVENIFRDATYPNTFEFLVEYLGTARLIGDYAVMHGYKVTKLERTNQFKFYLTVEAEKYHKDTLVDEVVEASNVDYDTPFIPEYVGRSTIS